MVAKHKRKGSDFQAASVATISTSLSDMNLSHGGRTSPTLDLAWPALQQKMQAMRVRISQYNTEGDPVVDCIQHLTDRPRNWQERIENLPYDAAAVEEKLDSHLARLEKQWKIKSEMDSARQEELNELRTKQQMLQGHADELEADLHDARNALVQSQKARQRAQEAQQQGLLEMARKIPRLQQQISMYAMCTGIKWDYDNEEAWTGNVVRRKHVVLFRFGKSGCHCFLISLSLIRTCRPSKHITAFTFRKMRCPMGR